jgi:tRNA(Ile)-lysidine synthase
MPQQGKRQKQVAIRFTDQVDAALDQLRVSRGRMLAAVSGGPDSTALLLALNALRRKRRMELIAVHANHALRGSQSDCDERFVRDLCKRLRLELVCSQLPVPLDAASRDEGIEVTARLLRLQLFSNTAAQLGAKFVATAHTADDQAETVLHRIVRGTALAGLAGIPPARELMPGVMLIRPLLDLNRGQVLEYLTALRQEYRQDRSNYDLTFTRNRLRHELIPYLTEHFNPRLSETLTRLSRNAAEVQFAIDAQVDRLRRRAAAKHSAQSVSFRASALRNVPPFLVRELVRRLWTQAGWPLRELGQADLERIEHVASGKLRSWDLPHGIRAARIRGQLVLLRTSKNG